MIKYLFLILLVLFLTKQIYGNSTANYLRFIGYVKCGDYSNLPCVASLISHNFLITSGSCLDKGMCKEAHLDARNILQTETFQTEIQIRHPSPAKLGKHVVINNIGLVKLKYRLGKKLNISFAKINEEEISGKECYSIRWNGSGNLVTENVGTFWSCEKLKHTLEDLSLGDDVCTKFGVSDLGKNAMKANTVGLQTNAVPLICNHKLAGILFKTIPNDTESLSFLSYWTLLRGYKEWINAVLKDYPVSLPVPMNYNLPHQKFREGIESENIMIPDSQLRGGPPDMDERGASWRRRLSTICFIFCLVINYVK